MQEKPKVYYGGKDVFSGISPTPFVYFEKEYIDYSKDWGSKYSISIDGQITGILGEYSRQDLEDKKNALIKNFSEDYLNLSIIEGSSQEIIENCTVESISFNDSKYYGILPYKISLSSYDKQSFVESFFVIEPSDSWDFSESEDGLVTITHSISAVGINEKNKTAIQNAKDWVNSKKGISNKIQSLKIKNINVSDLILDSVSEKIDRFSGKYSLDEVYIGDSILSGLSGFGVLRFTVDVSKNLEEGITSVSINGSVYGKTNKGEADLTPLRNRVNSFNFFQQAAEAARSSTGTTKVNSQPVSKKITESKEKSEISFSFVFDDDPVPPGQAKVIYSVDMSENLIKNIVDVKIDAEIVCPRGDLSVRWDAVKNFYEKNFKPYSLAINEYKRAGYSKNFSSYAKSESVSFDEFNSKITYSASWSDRYMPFPEILSSITERVEYSPSINIYATQPSLFQEGNHNVQNFRNAKRANVSISIEATGRPDKTFAQVKSAVLSEASRLRSLYVKGSDVITNSFVENSSENLKKFSVDYKYSFGGTIIS
jgi:hypothetical protein